MEIKDYSQKLTFQTINYTLTKWESFYFKKLTIKNCIIISKENQSRICLTNILQIKINTTHF